MSAATWTICCNQIPRKKKICQIGITGSERRRCAITNRGWSTPQGRSVGTTSGFPLLIMRIIRKEFVLRLVGEFPEISTKCNLTHLKQLSLLCRNIDRPCKFSAFFPHNYRTACVQKYHFKKLLALDEGGQLRIESFSIPSYCECSIIIMS